MAMNEAIRRFLELLGVIESKQVSVKRKLGLLSQAKPRGPVDLLVHMVGPKNISALAAIRKISGLSLDDALVFSEMLPWPLLRKVSLEAAEEARERLERVGVEVELRGMSHEKSALLGETNEQTDVKVEKLPGTMSAGDYVVTLVEVGLLEHRIIERMRDLIGLSEAQAKSICGATPRTIVSGVDIESAHHLQRELQMMGAVVDVVQLQDQRITEMASGLDQSPHPPLDETLE